MKKIVNLCKDDHELLKTHVYALAKKRGQLKPAVTVMIQQV